jgi:glycosyltransferase involved in cell wall biosynthesis
VYQVARGLAERLGYDCHLAFTKERGRKCDRFAAPFAERHRVDQPSEWGSLCERLVPDVICVNNLTVDHLAAVAAVAVPTVRMVHDHELSCLSGKRLYTWNGQACDRTMGRGCWVCLGFVGRQQGRIHLNRLSTKRRLLELTGRLDGVLVASRYMRDQLAQAGIAAGRIEVIPPGLDSELTYHAAELRVRIGHNTAPPAAGGEGWGGREDEFRPGSTRGCIDQHKVPARSAAVQLLFAGQVIRGKGLDLLLRALARLPDNCRLAVAGTGNALEKNRALAGRLGVADRVNFLGWVGPGPIDECYAAADIVVVPSRWPEPFGLVGLEAMSRARPAVAFDVGGISDWLEHGRTGLLAPQVDGTTLADAIRQLADQPDLRHDMGLAAREVFLQKFTLDAMVERLSKCFETVVARASRVRSVFGARDACLTSHPGRVRH